MDMDTDSARNSRRALVGTITKIAIGRNDNGDILQGGEDSSNTTDKTGNGITTVSGGEGGIVGPNGISVNDKLNNAATDLEETECQSNCDTCLKPNKLVYYIERAVISTSNGLGTVLEDSWNKMRLYMGHVMRCQLQ